MGMESLAGDEDTVFGIIEMVSQERMTQILHVDPDLMGASGLQDQGYQTKSVALMDDFIMGYSGFTMFGIDPPGDDGIFSPSDRSIDGSGGRRDCPADDGQIFPFDFMADAHLGKHGGGDPVFGNDSEAGGIPVQAVGAAENKGLLFFLKVPGQGIGQGVV